LAGTYGVYGFTDGPGSTALFDGPIGLTVDGSGNVYVADDGNNSIRKVTSQGVVTTLFPPAQFSRPSGTAVDGFGNIYVADTANDTIRKITPGKVVVTFAGTAGVVGSADGISAAARFHSPQGVALDGSGNVYVADSGNDTIRKITPSGVVTTLAGAAGVIGSTDAVTATAARFNNPTGVALDGSSNIFVADSGNDTIREITTAGVVSTFAGTAGASGSTNNTGPAARFNLPTGVAVDTNYNVYVADAGNELIRKITSAGVVTTLAGMVGVSGLTDATTGTAAQFNNPTGVAVDGSGNVYVADTGNHTVRGITSAGAVTTLSGVAEVPGFQDGPPGELNGPQGIAVDARGNFYVADTRNNAIREGRPIRLRRWWASKSPSSIWTVIPTTSNTASYPDPPRYQGWTMETLSRSRERAP
jgi:sugar lactone lactonase YvrE